MGYVTKKEFPDENIIGLSKIADEKMYAEKSNFYANMSVDRRGQSSAYKALFRTFYTKILRINITEDRKSVV